MVLIEQALTEKQIRDAKKLFIEYSNHLGIDLSFQNFKEELNKFPGQYSPPEGCIFLAYYKKKPIGCVGLRKFKDDICEMKRLYIHPKFRKKGIGKTLATTIINESKEIGYKYMRLDTLPFMTEAITLYLALGFKEISPYRYNPFENAKFFEVEL
ncbi:MAG: GNAT family N-acetyltransferase [Candidatus Thorarchaeota archaeon]